MAKIVWELGDVFSSGDNVGVVVNDNAAIIVKPPRNRSSRHTVEKAPIPENAVPAKLDRMNYDMQMALRGAMAVCGLPTSGSMLAGEEE